MATKRRTKHKHLVEMVAYDMSEKGYIYPSTFEIENVRYWSMSAARKYRRFRKVSRRHYEAYDGDLRIKFVTRQLY